jgi:transposase, IS30 family
VALSVHCRRMCGVDVVSQGVAFSNADRGKAIRLLRAGSSHRDAARAVGCSSPVVDRWAMALGGVYSDHVGRSARCLSFDEREEISRGLAVGLSLAVIAKGLGRSPSTVSREVGANGGRQGYRAGRADRRATCRAKRPKTAKLVVQPRLGEAVSELLELLWSPQQIARFLRGWFGDDPEMWVSHETIYQSLFVQGRGALRKELAACLRSGRTQRRPRAKDPAIRRGHWEGDLIVGAFGRSAIGTLVERTSRYVMLLWLPNGHGADQVREAMTAKIMQLPEQLRRSVTWDQGAEMAGHATFTLATNIPVYFCDPHSPWQRGSNENTNGLLRQYFPKSTDLSVHTEAHLDYVANQLNSRPRQTLGDRPPSHALNTLIAMTA